MCCLIGELIREDQGSNSTQTPIIATTALIDPIVFKSQITTSIDIQSHFPLD